MADCKACGYMEKYGGSPLRREWKRCFFEVKGYSFSYFNDDDLSIRTKLGGGYCQKVTQRSQNALILTCNKGKCYKLRCYTQEECEYWMEAFTAAAWKFFNAAVDSPGQDGCVLPDERDGYTTNPSSPAKADNHGLNRKDSVRNKLRRMTFASFASNPKDKSFANGKKSEEGPWNNISLVSTDALLNERCGGVLPKDRRRHGSVFSRVSHIHIFGGTMLHHETRSSNHHLAPPCTSKSSVVAETPFFGLQMEPIGCENSPSKEGTLAMGGRNSSTVRVKFSV